MKINFKETSVYLTAGMLFLVFIPFFLYFISEFIEIDIFDNEFIAFIISFPLLILGVAIMLWTNMYMRNVGKGGPVDGFGIAFNERTKVLMTGGPYKFCRNPMLFGTFIYYMGFGFLYNSFSALLFCLLFLIFMRIYIQKFEEPRLDRDFKEQYANYKSAVPMIFPKLRIK